jgi:hypothetical protein
MVNTSGDTLNATSSSTDSWNLYEAGSFAGNSYSLSSVAYGESATDASAMTATSLQTQSGLQTNVSNGTLAASLSMSYAQGSLANTAGSTITSGQTTVGTQTSTASETVVQSSGDSWSLSEQGTYGTESYNLSSLVYQGTQTSTGTSQQSDRSSYTSGYTGVATESRVSGGTFLQGLGNNNGNLTHNIVGTATDAQANYATDAMTDTGHATYTWLDQGSFAGDSYALSSVNETRSAADSFTMTGSSSQSDTSTLFGSLTLNQGYASGGTSASLQSNSSTGLDSASQAANATYTIVTSQGAQSTYQGGDSYTQTDSGRFSNNSYSLSNWTDQSTDSGTSSGQQTDTVGETLTASGTLSSSSQNTTTSAVQGVIGGVPVVGTMVNASANSYTNVFSGTVALADTVTLSQAGTYNESSYQSGSFGNGSFALGCMSYNVLRTDSSTIVDSSYQTTNDTISATQTQSASHQGGNVDDDYSGWNAGTFVQNDTVTQNSTITTTNGDTYALYEAGSMAGGSWSLSSYTLNNPVFAAAALLTTTSSRTSQNGSFAGQRTADGFLVYNLAGVFTILLSKTSTESHSGGLSFNFGEQGSFSQGSFSLSSFVLAQVESSTDSVSGTSSATESYSGTNTLNSSGATFSGLETSSGSSQETASSTDCFSEQGSYSAGTFSLGTVSYSVAATDSCNAQDSTTASWSGGYSGQDTAVNQSSAITSLALAAAGSYTGGSFSLASYLLQGSSAGTYSSADSSQQSQGGATSSYTLNQGGQASDSVYQAGTQNTGGYSNGSYNLQQSSTASVNSAWSGPTYASSNTWQQQSTATQYASGGPQQTSAATYSYQNGLGAGTLSNGTSTTGSTSAPAGLVRFLSPDGSVVPTEDAVTLRSASKGGGAEAGTGLEAPVAVNIPGVVQVTSLQQWAAQTNGVGLGEVDYAWQTVVGGITPDGRAILASANDGGPIQNNPLAAATAAALSSSFLPTPAAPLKSANYGQMAWNALQPLFTLLKPLHFTASAASQSAVQGLLGVQLPTPASYGNAGDAFVNWVDEMLYNNGQPLTAGSAPLYGTYWNGYGVSAQEALSEAAPYVAGGVGIVAGMWMVGPAGLMGVMEPAIGALSSGGLDIFTNAAGGGTSGMVASGFGSAFFQGAVQGSAEAVGGMVFGGLQDFKPNNNASWDGALGKGQARLSELTQGGALTEASLGLSEGGAAAWMTNCFLPGTVVWVAGTDGLAVPLAAGQPITETSVALAGGDDAWWWDGAHWRWLGIGGVVLLAGLSSAWLVQATRTDQRRRRQLLPRGSEKGVSDAGGSGDRGELAPQRVAEEESAGGLPLVELSAARTTRPEAASVLPQAVVLPRPRSRIRQVLAMCGLLSALLLATLLLWEAPGTTSPRRGAAAILTGPSAPDSQLAEEARTANGQVAQLRRIETIRLGERVLGRNPQRQGAVEPEPDPATWRQVDLELSKDNGRLLYAGLLRGPEWLAAHKPEVGGRVWLDLPEMGALGWAKVLAVGPCPPIKPGPGSVVTGTFKHEPDDNVLNVRLAGLAEPIGVTDAHPFWSEDRGMFVPVGKLRPGERVRTEVQGVVAVTSIQRRPRESWVYTLEVLGEHVYEVSPLGVLVHNASGHLNSNNATGHFGLYEIYVNGELYKIGKADLDRVTESSGLPTRLHQQLRKLRERYGKDNVTGGVVEDLGMTTTAEAKAAETSRIQQHFDNTGMIPPGNIPSFKPRPSVP